MSSGRDTNDGFEIQDKSLTRFLEYSMMREFATVTETGVESEMYLSGVNLEGIRSSYNLVSIRDD